MKFIYKLTIICLMMQFNLNTELKCQVNKFYSHDVLRNTLDLNGTNERLIDNALRIFGLNSLGGLYDSLYRIWYLLPIESKDGKDILNLKLMEIGKKDGKENCSIYSLSWTTIDSGLIVLEKKIITCNPKSGWFSLDSLFKVYKISHIINFDCYYPKNPSMSNYGLQILQFINYNNVKTFDFSFDSGPPNEYPKKYHLLFKGLIYAEFPGLFLKMLDQMD